MKKTANPETDGYVEWPVHPGLAPHIVCTWRDSPRSVRPPVMPDACIDLVWDGSALVVAGPDTHAVAVSPDDSFTGIRFRPGAAPGFLGVAASELLDTRAPLDELWGAESHALADRMREQPDTVTTLFEDALLRRLDGVRAPDHLVEEVVHELSRPHRDRVSDLTTQLGTSERTLRRRCADALGYGPKTLERVLRFRRALRLLRRGLPLTEVALLAGYADQAHLTNECQRLASATPSALALNARGPLSANGF